MTTYARNVNNIAVDVTTTNPAEIFHPEVALQFIVVPDGTLNGAIYANGAWTNPTASASTATTAVYPDLTPMQFYDAFAVGEAIAIKGSKDPIMQEAWFRVQTALTTNTPVNPAVVQKLLAYASAANQDPQPGVGIYLPGALTPVPAWSAGETVTAGSSLAVGNSVYTATTGGATATTGSGPAGTGSAINDGTVIWEYTPTPYILPARIPQILAGTPQ